MGGRRPADSGGSATIAARGLGRQRKEKNEESDDELRGETDEKRE